MEAEEAEEEEEEPDVERGITGGKGGIVTS